MGTAVFMRTNTFITGRQAWDLTSLRPLFSTGLTGSCSTITVSFTMLLPASYNSCYAFASEKRWGSEKLHPLASIIQIQANRNYQNVGVIVSSSIPQLCLTFSTLFSWTHLHLPLTGEEIQPAMELHIQLVLLPYFFFESIFIKKENSTWDISHC